MDPRPLQRKFAPNFQKVIIPPDPSKGREATIVDIKIKQGTEPVHLQLPPHTTFTIVATATALSNGASPLKGS